MHGVDVSYVGLEQREIKEQQFHTEKLSSRLPYDPQNSWEGLVIFTCLRKIKTGDNLVNELHRVNTYQ